MEVEAACWRDDRDIPPAVDADVLAEEEEVARPVLSFDHERRERAVGNDREQHAAAAVHLYYTAGDGASFDIVRGADIRMTGPPGELRTVAAVQLGL